MEKINYIVEIIAKWLEILGFLISLATGLKVFFVLDKRVKILQMKHLYDVRISDHLTKLKKTSAIISKLIGNFSLNIHDIRTEIIICHENCKSLKTKTGDKNLVNLKKLIKVSNAIIRNRLDIHNEVSFLQKVFRKKPINQRNIDDFYEILNALITEIDHFNKDMQKAI